jgi:hypothetical protein
LSSGGGEKAAAKTTYRIRWPMARLVISSVFMAVAQT